MRNQWNQRDQSEESEDIELSVESGVLRVESGGLRVDIGVETGFESGVWREKSVE